VNLPDGLGQAQIGFDVEFDPIRKLFLIFQADGPTEHSYIQVYDPNGTFENSIDFGPSTGTATSHSPQVSAADFWAKVLCCGRLHTRAAE
jgi:hypothetical protein